MPSSSSHPTAILVGLVFALPGSAGCHLAFDLVIDFVVSSERIEVDRIIDSEAERLIVMSLKPVPPGATSSSCATTAVMMASPTIKVPAPLPGDGQSRPLLVIKVLNKHALGQAMEARIRSTTSL